MSAPHYVEQLKRTHFMDWLERQGATVLEPTNPYEVVRYKMFVTPTERRPSTHIIYRRGNETLTYHGMSREHYERFVAEAR